MIEGDELRDHAAHRSADDVGGFNVECVEKAALYPLFTPELIQLMREVIPPERQDTVAVSVIARARKPF